MRPLHDDTISPHIVCFNSKLPKKACREPFFHDLIVFIPVFHFLGTTCLLNR